MSRPMGFERSPKGSGGAKNVRLAIVCALIFCGMVGAAFAAVPFYRAFCQATGFAGGRTERLNFWGASITR